MSREKLVGEIDVDSEIYKCVVRRMSSQGEGLNADLAAKACKVSVRVAELIWRTEMMRRERRSQGRKN